MQTTDHKASGVEHKVRKVTKNGNPEAYQAQKAPEKPSFWQKLGLGAKKHP